MTLVVVTASRKWMDHVDLGFEVIDDGLIRITRRYHPPYKLLHGAAYGGDLIAATLAITKNWDVEADPCTSSEWFKYGKAAGHRRNARMLARGPDVVLGVPFGEARGTRGCIKDARKLGIPTIIMTRYRRRNHATQKTDRTQGS